MPTPEWLYLVGETRYELLDRSVTYLIRKSGLLHAMS